MTLVAAGPVSDRRRPPTRDGRNWCDAVISARRLSDPAVVRKSLACASGVAAALRLTAPVAGIRGLESEVRSAHRLATRKAIDPAAQGGDGDAGFGPLVRR